MGNPNPSPATRFGAERGNKPAPPPHGRPKGSRDKLSTEFLSDLAEAWQANGKAALTAVATDDPASFCRIVASLQPKEVEIKTPESALSDEQVEQLYHEMLLRMAGKETKRDQIWQ